MRVPSMIPLQKNCACSGWWRSQTTRMPWSSLAQVMARSAIPEAPRFMHRVMGMQSTESLLGRGLSSRTCISGAGHRPAPFPALQYNS